jgi:sodium transport system permease protein
MPLIIPAFIIMMGYFYDSIESTSGNVIGVNYELSEVESEIMKSVDKNLDIKVKTEEELTQAFNNGEIDGYVIKNNEFYYIYLDTSSTKGMTISSLLNVYFEQYNNYLARNYLLENNINPDEVFNQAKVELKEQAKEGTNFFTNFLVSFALIYLVMIITITSMNITTDVIAGEKERGTFETLLTFPLTSNEIIGGKLLSIVISCIISSLIGISTAIPAFMLIKEKTETFKDFNFNITSNSIVLAIITLIILSALIGVISIFLCGRAKTFKEAQSKVSFLSFVSIVPMFTSMMNISNDTLYMIPIANGGTILNDIFIDGINMNNFMMFVASSLIVTVLVLIIVSKQYKDEKALF